MEGGTMSSFKDLRIVDNFYQTSLFFPMPTVLISTLAEDGSTSLGPYSLVQPYYVAGKEYYAMLLNCRNSSNTAQHILRTGKCAINFIPDDRKYFKWAVKLGWPGDTPAEKMKDCRFTLERGLADRKEGPRPLVVKESFQVIECTWMRHLDGADRDEPGQMEGYEPPYHDFNGITSKFGVWYTRFPGFGNIFGAIPELLPIRATTVQSVMYAADRIDPEIKFTEEACAKLVNVPRIFLPTALKGCVAWAKENGVTLITEEHMNIINDKRAKEKKK